MGIIGNGSKMKSATSITILTFMLAAACGGKTPEPDKPLERGLDAPAGVALASDPGETSLSFKWEAVKGADEYRYRLLNGMTEEKSGASASTSVTFDGLEDATEYGFDVCAANAASQSAWSRRITAKTKKQASSDPAADPAARYAEMQMPASEEDGITRAFPGASGGGMLTTGGRGGKIIHVTNLNDSGKGSLRDAISQTGPRTIVFDVAGTIELQKTLKIESGRGDVTIAGQTAPGDGICLKNYSFRINADNVIIRCIRCRMGDEKGTEDDAMCAYCQDIPGLKNIIIDHCSMSWSTDECGSFYGITDFTLQYCILSESLRNSIHDKGKHGYGGIWGGVNASYHHNLLAHHDSRNPRFDHDFVSKMKGPVHCYNNVFYNWGGNSAYGGESGPGQKPRQINIVNNYYKPGPASSHRTRIVNPTTKCSNCNKNDQYDIVPGQFYVDGNIMDGSTEVTENNSSGVEPDDKALKDKVISPSYQGGHPGMQTAQKAFETVLATAGASLSRDSVDERIVRETREGSWSCKGSNGSSNGLIDTQTDAGGWPSYNASDGQKALVADTDGDGMPDWFEDKFGLAKGDAADGNAMTIDIRGRYTNIEMYLHYLMRDVVAGQK